MYLARRNEHNEVLNPYEIIRRLTELSKELDCDPMLISQNVFRGGHQVITTEVIADYVADMADNHPDYASLATRLAVSDLYKNTKPSFSETIRDMYERSGEKDPLVVEDVYNIIMEHAAQLDSLIEHERDLDFDYIGLKILERSYLLKIKGTVVERPQHMLMRVAVGIHKKDISSLIRTYQWTSQRYFTHASTILFNAGTPKPQLSSCFLVCMQDGSIKGIFDTLTECAFIGESTTGGISVSVHNFGSTGHSICGTKATSSRFIPMLRILNDTIRYVEGGRRKGTMAVYLEPWHIDIFEFLDLRKNHGKEEHRVRDLFYALWVPDLFMNRVTGDDSWSLFCPSEAPGLADCWGQDFEDMYTQYEREGKAKKSVKARTLWNEVLKSHIETGTLCMLFKDSCNRKSNQKNLGTIKSSSLCGEIIEYASPTETAMCCLASIALPLCVEEEGVPLGSKPSKRVGSIDSGKRHFNFTKLAEITSFVAKS